MRSLLAVVSWLCLCFSLAGAAPLPNPVASAGRTGAAPVADPLQDADEAGDDEQDDGPLRETFETDPLSDPDAVVAGEALGRLGWQPDAPAFPGDTPGSLSALYDSSLPAGLFGFALPQSFDQDSTFTAAAVFVISPAGFIADPDGFFEISWGLWNSSHTGLNRTGTLAAAADSYELLDFAWFPNVSPFFGGPFLGPAAFGAEPPGGDAFSNFTSVFGLETALPLGVPLLAVLEHRPAVDALVTQVYRIAGDGTALPVDGAAAVVPLDFLAQRAYALDAVGLTLWHDGFDGLFGPSPAVRATLTYPALVVFPGLAGRPEELLHAED